jgi:hypothetical protein
VEPSSERSLASASFSEKYSNACILFFRVIAALFDPVDERVLARRESVWRQFLFVGNTLVQLGQFFVLPRLLHG